ncbi:MAG: hypothetical protein OEY33_00945 [Bdellovibrionales bacterium]|jgi:regulator of replication initiation timing|nr:hypothetical protein [Bdellovibrionales bacterium]
MKLAIILLIFASCVKEEYSEKTCQDLAYKTYKGFPLESKKFKNNCLEHDLKHSVQSCQKALEKMIVGKNKQELEKLYGEGIHNCFSENDIKKFLKH